MRQQLHQDHVFAKFPTWLARLSVILLVASIVAIGIYTRFYQLGAKSLWGDEIWTGQRGGEPVWSIVRAYLDLPGPVYYLLAHVTLRFFDHDHAEFALRLPSAMASSLVIIASFFSTRRLHGVWPAIIGALLLAVSPYQVWYAQEARFYAVSTLLALPAWYCCVRILLGQSSREYWCGFVLFSTLNLYTQPLPAFILLASLACCVVLVLARKRLYRTFLVWFAAYSAIGALYLPALVKMFIARFSGGTIGNYVDYGAEQQLFSPSLAGIGSSFVTVGATIVRSFAAEGPVWLLFLLLALVATGYLIATRQWITVVCYIVPFVVAFLVFVIAHPINGFNVRYILFLQPLYLTLVAVGIVQSGPATLRLIQRPHAHDASSTPRMWIMPVKLSIVLVLLLTIVSASVRSVQHSYTQAKINDWRALANYLQAEVRPGDIIVGSVWFHDALSWYFTNDSVVWFNDDQQAARDYALAGDRVWYVLLESIGGAYSQQLQEQLARVDDSAWQPSDLRYRDVSFFFPVSEVPARLFAGGPPYVQSRHFYDVPEPNWADRSYRQLAPGESLHLALGSTTDGEQMLSVTYFDAPEHTLQVQVAEMTVALPIDDQFAWRTVQIPLHDQASVVPVTITAVGADTTGVSDVALGPVAP